jgi:hypothetical protein
MSHLKLWFATLALAMPALITNRVMAQTLPSCTAGTPCSDVFGTLVANDSRVTAVGSISEAAEAATVSGATLAIPVPAGTVYFTEPGTSLVSDIVSWNAFNLALHSDKDTPSAAPDQREAAVVDFRLVSDADPSTGPVSDRLIQHVTVLQNGSLVSLPDITLLTLCEPGTTGCTGITEDGLPHETAPTAISQQLRDGDVTSDLLTSDAITFTVTSDLEASLGTVPAGADVINGESGNALTAAAFSDFIPEPASLAVVATGWLGLVFARRRKTKQA